MRKRKGIRMPQKTKKEINDSVDHPNGVVLVLKIEEVLNSKFLKHDDDTPFVINNK